MRYVLLLGLLSLVSAGCDSSGYTFTEAMLTQIWFTLIGINASICAYVGWRMGHEKKRPRLGFWLPFFLGPLGVIIVALVPAAEPPIDYSRRDSPGPGSYEESMAEIRQGLQAESRGTASPATEEKRGTLGDAR